jgi:glycosyltransferase involved in cell wall biosynthesis
MPPISGTIITYNEEDHIEACIASLRTVCAEVVVVDSLSTDRTVELAQAAGARVVSQAYLGEGPQRNLTEKLAAHDWILALDADERLDGELEAAIRGLSLADPEELRGPPRDPGAGFLSGFRDPPVQPDPGRL